MRTKNATHTNFGHLVRAAMRLLMMPTTAHWLRARVARSPLPSQLAGRVACAHRRRRPAPSLHAPAASTTRHVHARASIQGGAGLGEATDEDTEEEEPEVLSPDPDENVYIEIGIVGPPHGVKGEFKVQSLTDWPEERLGQKGTRYLRPPETTFHMARLQARTPGSASGPSAQATNRVTKVTLMRGQASVYKGREVYICKIKGINTPEEAREIHGHTLLVHESARDDLDDDDEFYVQELVGLRVELLASGEEVGVVEDLMDGTGTHDVLQIVNGAGQRILLPFVKELVPEVDVRGAGVIRIEPPEGLLEVYTREVKKKTDKRRRPRKQL